MQYALFKPYELIDGDPPLEKTTWDWNTSMQLVEKKHKALDSHYPGESLLLSKEVNKSGARIYCHTSHESLFRRFSDIEETHRMYHEHFIADQPVWFFLDVEAPFEGGAPFGTMEEFKKIVCEKLLIGCVIRMVDRIKKSLNVPDTLLPSSPPLHSSDFLIEDSCATGEKYSVHIKCGHSYRFGFLNETHRQRFQADLFVNCETVLAKSWEEYDDAIHQYKTTNNTTLQTPTPEYHFRSLYVNGKPIFDLKIFQSLRMLYCHKMKDIKRPLIPWPPRMSEDGKQRSSSFSVELLKQSMVTYFPHNQEHLVFSYPECFSDAARMLISIHGSGRGTGKTNSNNNSNQTEGEGDKFEWIQSFPKYDKLYHILYELVRGIYDKAGFKDLEISLSDHIKLNERKDRLMITIQKGPCLMKWFHTGTHHSHPNGLGFFLNLYSCTSKDGERDIEPTMMLGCKKGCLRKYDNHSIGSGESDSDSTKIQKQSLTKTLTLQRHQQQQQQQQQDYKSIYDIPKDKLAEIHKILREASLLKK